MTTTFTVATGAELTSALQDISAGADAAPETAYTIALAQNVALSSVTLALEAGSSLTLEGPGAAIIDDLTVSGTVTAATPFTGTITLSGGTLATALATDNGGGRIDGGVQGIAPDGDVVDNAGSIVDTAGGGVSLLAGDVANGSASDAAALISGSYGLSFSGAGASLADATVTNFGSIVGTSAAGVYIAGGGTVTNGSAAVTSASLMGDLDGVQVDGQAAIRNFGTILGGTYPGVFVGSGSVVNGSATDHAALIDALGTTSTPDGSQNVGVASYDPATITTVTNFGTIGGHVATGVFLTDGSVDNGAGGTITGTGQGVVLLASGAVTDAGAINGTGTDAVGVLLEGGGSLSVLVGGTLGGDGFGVSSSGSASVTNLGGISGTLGVDLGAGGTLVNGAAGVQDADIVGAAAGYGVRIAGGPGEVTNFGTISGGVGVSFYLGAGSGAGVVTNAGAIVSSGGASGIAVQFGAGAERLVLDAGSSIVGRVVGDDGAGSSTVLELAAGSAATFSGLGGDAGTLAGASGSFGFSGISGIELDAGAAASAGGSLASLTLDGTLTAAGTLAVGAVTGGGAAVIATGGTLVIENGATFGTGSGTAQYAGPTIEGLSPGETIELASLPGAGATIDSFDPASGLLQLSSGAESATLKLGNIAAGEHLQLAADAAGGTDITEVPCYARGTRILTSRGEMAVEALRCGDLVVTLLGRGAALKPVRWLGRRHITPGRHQRPESVWPVRIGAGALADRQPHRDLIVSPGHRIQLDGALVCAADLVNGASIVQERLDTIEYWHVELDAHDVLLAEGLPAESYLDTGNRDGFDDARLVRLAAPLDGLPAPSTARPCLPYETPSQMWRHRLALRAEALGWRREADPHPWLEVDGARVEPVRSGRSYRFALPAGCTEARLRSRAGRPRDGDVASTDWRRLGLSLRSLALIGEAGRREVALDDPRLDAGFLTPERDGGTIWRWTDGDALLPLAELADGGAVSAIEVGIDQTLLFWVAPGRNVEPVARSA